MDSACECKVCLQNNIVYAFSLLIPSKVFFEMEMISGHQHPQMEETSNAYTILILKYRK